MKKLILLSLILTTTSSFAGIFGKPSVNKLADDLIDDRETTERFVGRDNSSRSSCRFFYKSFNERKAKLIADARTSKKKYKDIYILEEIEDLDVSYCETLAKEYAYDP